MPLDFAGPAQPNPQAATPSGGGLQFSGPVQPNPLAKAQQAVATGDSNLHKLEVGADKTFSKSLQGGLNVLSAGKRAAAGLRNYVDTQGAQHEADPSQGLDASGPLGTAPGFIQHPNKLVDAFKNAGKWAMDPSKEEQANLTDRRMAHEVGVPTDQQINSSMQHLPGWTRSAARGAADMGSQMLFDPTMALGGAEMDAAKGVVGGAAKLAGKIKPVAETAKAVAESPVGQAVGKVANAPKTLFDPEHNLRHLTTKGKALTANIRDRYAQQAGRVGDEEKQVLLQHANEIQKGQIPPEVQSLFNKYGIKDDEMPDLFTKSPLTPQGDVDVSQLARYKAKDGNIFHQDKVRGAVDALSALRNSYYRKVAQSAYDEAGLKNVLNPDHFTDAGKKQISDWLDKNNDVWQSDKHMGSDRTDLLDPSKIISSNLLKKGANLSDSELNNGLQKAFQAKQNGLYDGKNFWDAQKGVAEHLKPSRSEIGEQKNDVQSWLDKTNNFRKSIFLADPLIHTFNLTSLAATRKGQGLAAVADGGKNYAQIVSGKISPQLQDTLDRMAQNGARPKFADIMLGRSKIGKGVNVAQQKVLNDYQTGLAASIFDRATKAGMSDSEAAREVMSTLGHDAPNQIVKFLEKNFPGANFPKFHVQTVVGSTAHALRNNPNAIIGANHIQNFQNPNAPGPKYHLPGTAFTGLHAISDPVGYGLGEGTFGLTQELPQIKKDFKKHPVSTVVGGVAKNFSPAPGMLDALDEYVRHRRGEAGETPLQDAAQSVIGGYYTKR